MATVSRTMQAPPADVFAVLSDGWLYSNWVVGTSHVRAVDVSWPSTGSRLHHASGAWPLVTRDESTVLEVDPERRLVLVAKGRPFGQARVVIELSPQGGGTRVSMTEKPIAGLGKWIDNPVTEALIARRNVECLARLSAMAERRRQPDE